MAATNAKYMFGVYADIISLTELQRETITRFLDTAYQEGRLDRMMETFNATEYATSYDIQHKC